MSFCNGCFGKGLDGLGVTCRTCKGKPIECPLCFRKVKSCGLLAEGYVMAPHESTPLLGELCDGSNRTEAGAKIHARELLEKWKKRVRK